MPFSSFHLQPYSYFCLLFFGPHSSRMFFPYESCFQFLWQLCVTSFDTRFKRDVNILNIMTYFSIKEYHSPYSLRVQRADSDAGHCISIYNCVCATNKSNIPLTLGPTLCNTVILGLGISKFMPLFKFN